LTKSPLFPFPVPTNRDVLVFQFDNGEVIVVGCDSAGGIGPKQLDKLKVDGYTLGKFTARVALMEVLSVGANPICVVDTLSVEPEPTGNDILRGIRDEAIIAGLDPKLAVTGSTEKTFPVEQTGIGVTVIGMSRKAELRIGVSKPNDIVAAIGVPCVGEEVVPAGKEGKIAETTDVLKLRNIEFIHDIIPVGSEGIAFEVGTLAEGANLKFKFADQQEVDVKKHAGPATVILATLPKLKLAELEHAINKPVNTVAQLCR